MHDQSQSLVDLNSQITLMRVPTSSYPTENQDIFQIKFVAPTPIDQLKEGEIIVKNIFFSIDATMRVWISGAKSYMEPIRPGDIMKGQGVAIVIYSNSKKFQKGDHVLGLTFWQKYSVVSQKMMTKIPSSHPRLYDFLGVLGISGLTAYFGFQKIGKLQAGEVVVISAAAGAVGEIAVQLAKLKGCIVCGIVGDDEKCKYIKSIGSDYAINYKKWKVVDKLKEYFPEGVDVYFDNVGGEMLDDILMLIKQRSRIIACGAISTYQNLGSQNQPYRLKNYSRMIIKQATMQGFLYFDYAKQFPAAIAQLSSLISKKQLRYRVDMRIGLEECPSALRRLLKGENEGKTIVCVEKAEIEAKL